jgi:hypothetical protein
MATIEDVRKTLWAAYKWLEATPFGCECKSHDGACEVIYGSILDYEQERSFIKPQTLRVYAYCLGPSRWHEFHASFVDTQKDERTWYCVDPFATAVQTIKDWVEEKKRELEEDNL